MVDVFNIVLQSRLLTAHLWHRSSPGSAPTLRRRPWALRRSPVALRPGDVAQLPLAPSRRRFWRGVRPQLPQRPPAVFGCRNTSGDGRQLVAKDAKQRRREQAQGGQRMPTVSLTNGCAPNKTNEIQGHSMQQRGVMRSSSAHICQGLLGAAGGGEPRPPGRRIPVQCDFPCRLRLPARHGIKGGRHFGWRCSIPKRRCRH